MLKLMVIFGTRPEAIKFAPLLRVLQESYRGFRLIIVNAGQHKELLDNVLDSFSIQSDYNLRIMRDNQSLFDLAIRLLPRFENILKREKPDLVLVQGDTSTAFLACLSAFYFRIPIAHIEAGLRSYDKYNPFPEEINRRLIDALSDLLFAPTSLAKGNLIKEGISKDKIFIVGNTGIDALLNIAKKINYKKIPPIFKNIDFKKRILLITIHRRESFGKPLIDICKAIRIVAKKEKDIEIVFPVHPNPNVKKRIHSILGKIRHIHLIRPINYREFIILAKKSYLILTDSGGIQEEAPYLKKPVLVLRNRTERPEVIKAKVAKLVGTNSTNIINAVRDLLKNKYKYQKMIKSIKPYGNGTSSKQIVKILINLLQYNIFESGL